MTADPEFMEPGKSKRVGSAPPPRLWRYLAWTLLGLMGCHMLGTGSPIPLWHIERLDHPTAVRSVAPDALLLADGRRVRLPFIKRIPINDPIFRRAIRHGVELNATGTPVVLIDSTHTCGNDRVYVYRQHANLNELAGALDPDAIDAAIVHREEIRSLRENDSVPRDSRRSTALVLWKSRRIHDVLERAASNSTHKEIATDQSRLK